MRHIKEPTQPVTLSVEEEAIMIDEQNAETMLVRAEEVDTERLLDTHAILTDTQAAMSEISSVGDVELSLVDAISEMAVAGSDVDPVEVLPVPPEGVSTESFVGDVVERAKKLWEQIYAMIKKAWDHVKKFFANIVQFLSPSMRRAEEARKAREKEKEVEEILKSNLVAEEKAARLREIAAARAAVRHEASLVELPKKTAMRLALVEKEVDYHHLAQQMHNTYTQLNTQLTALGTGMCDLGDVLLQAINAIISNPVQVEEITQKLSAAYNNRFGRMVKEMGLPGKEMLGGVGAKFESNRDPNFFDMEMGKIYTSEIDPMNNRVKTKIPALDDKAGDEVAKLAMDQLTHFKSTKWSFMGRLESTVKKLEEQISRLAHVSMYNALENGNAKGEKLNLDQQNAESRRLMAAKDHVMRLARNICATGPLCALGITLNASHLGDAATYYTTQSIINRTAEKVQKALEEFDRQHAA